MRRNDSKECGTCQALTCDPCPAMMGEDGAVLGLLERLIKAARGSVEFFHDGRGFTVSALTGTGYWPQPVCGRAATLLQALLLAAEALDGNEQDIGPSHDDPLIGD